ncbi:MAG: glycosyltransferase family 2 protein [Candidatus Njordarchaeales archaeon]
MRKKPYIVAGIPAYNEEKTIAKVVLLTKKYVDKVVVVDDGSTDMTAEIAEALGAEVIRHKENKGYGAALQTIFHKARREDADILVILDADGQHDPSEIPKLIEPIMKGKADIVIGSRFLGKTDAKKYRLMGVKMLTKATNILMKAELTDAQSGFRAYNKKAIQLIRPTEDGMGASVEILSQAIDNNLKIVEVPITIRYEGLETSSEHPLIHGAGVAGTLITKTIGRKPLRYLGVPGIMSIFAGLYFINWLVALYNQEHYFSLPMAIIALGFISVGIVLLSSAIIIHIVRNLEKKIIAYEYTVISHKKS